jgi:Carboxypeptidase regulatory-like domain
MVADAPSSGIEGRVIIRPVRPVERRGVVNQRPYQAKITVLDRAGSELAAVESDAEGRFRLSLPPGSYVLRPDSPGVYPRAAQQTVVVQRNQMTQIEIVYDSGMR